MFYFIAQELMDPKMTRSTCNWQLKEMANGHPKHLKHHSSSSASSTSSRSLTEENSIDLSKQVAPETKESVFPTGYVT